MDIYKLSQIFKIEKHEVYREILDHSNKINIILLENQNKIFDFVYDEILNTKNIIDSNDFVFDELEHNINIPFEKKPAIYFLYNNKRIVYIGKTAHLCERIATHVKDLKKDFDSVGFKFVDKSLLDMVEKLNIFYHKPILNKAVYSNIEYFKEVLKNCVFE